MAKGGSEFVARDWKGGRSLVNTDVLWPERDWAESQVLRIQTKLHQWAIDDPDRRFDDLFNLVCDPADRVGPHRSIGPEVGARADLRGGLQAMLLWLPSQAAGT